MSAERSPLGLRERKKQQTRATLLEVSRALFEERGYENVTVAEIADQADISVKTLFTYFRSKEDLAFANDHVLLERVLTALRTRPRDFSPADAVRDLLIEMFTTGEAGFAGIEGFHHLVGDSQALQTRLLRMWKEYEDETALLFRSELEGVDGPIRARLAAQEIIGMVRMFASPEVLALARANRSSEARRRALENSTRLSADFVRDGIGNLKASQG